ncbi:hypothetical protein [Spiroplasma endosymbiont of Polydrusus pterygomalis]|uniref:hypothetical protein n=1 Tax=Spiroplasma endosymbiont of Polydrusus pterygomalis TaxID=3139327 RepID=UPI003CCAB989
MNTQTTIEHLYIEIPNFKNKVITSYHYFIENINKQLILLTNNYQLKLKTIYFANKSKAVLPIIFLEQLLILLNPFSLTIEQYNFECTINNTNVITLQLLSKFKINRLVWKIISFQNQLSSNYHCQQSINLINGAINLKFTNFSIDLKYNLPHQTIIDVNNDLQICIQLKTPHISYDSYNKNQNLNIKKNINNFLKKKKYDNYEYYSYTNNPNNQSKYIIGYCLLENYYGIGRNAVSYIKTQKQTLIINNSKQKINVLSANETLMYKLGQGLLLKKGIPINNNDHFCQQPFINKLIKNKQIKITNNHLSCTNKSWLLLNDLIIDIITNTII